MPTLYQFMAYILRVMQDGEIRHTSAIVPLVSELAQVTEAQMTAVFPTGELVVLNRIRCGCWYFLQAGIFNRTAPATYQITELGRKKAVEWQDLDAITFNRFVGLSAWDAYNEIRKKQPNEDGTNDVVHQNSPSIQNLHEINIKIQRVDYASLNDRQKEHYNFAKVAGFLCEYGFHAIRLSDDWNGADFLALHKDKEITLKVQLKSSCTIYKKYQDKDIYLAFPAITNGKDEKKWYLLSHDLLIYIVGIHTNALETSSWKQEGLYRFPSLPQTLGIALQHFRIDTNAGYLEPNAWNNE